MSAAAKREIPAIVAELVRLAGAVLQHSRDQTSGVVANAPDNGVYVAYPWFVISARHNARLVERRNRARIVDDYGNHRMSADQSDTTTFRGHGYFGWSHPFRSRERRLLLRQSAEHRRFVRSPAGRVSRDRG